MIIGLSGKMQVGKDLSAKMIQVITSNSPLCISDNGYIRVISDDNLSIDGYHDSPFEIVKFGDALKEMVVVLTGCTREQLEDLEFKNSLVPDEWIRYGYADGFIKKYIGDGEMGTPIMNNKQCSKERYDAELNINWQTAYKQHLTYRQFMQYIGTDIFRELVHEDTWVNALFNKYKPIDKRNIEDPDYSNVRYPNWIISDIRFPNEVERTINTDSVNNSVIRIIKPDAPISDHKSEKALDDYTFNHAKHVLFNDCTKEALFKQLYNWMNTHYKDYVTFKY